LSYYDITEQAYLILDLDKDERIVLGNQTGELGTWSPTGLRFVVQELYPLTTDIPRGPTGEVSNDPVDEGELPPVVVAGGSILSFNTNTEVTTDLSQTGDVEDANPVFSFDGHWLAFGRRMLDEENPALGRQVWIMRSDGSQQRALTDTPNFKYTAFSWHPKEDLLAAVRIDNTILTDPPELWLLDVRSGEAFRLVIGGYAPQWIP
jgi:hypothetical protein